MEKVIVRYIKIESAQECIVSVDPEGDAVLPMEDVVQSVMRTKPKRLFIRALKGSCPAYEYWTDRLKPGERLPRGKYFTACEFFREFRNVTNNVTA